MGSTAKNTMNPEVKDDSLDKQNYEDVEDLEWSADQEILLLYSLNGYKPVGPNKHFRMLLIQDRLSNAMNKNISSKAIWKKLNTLYDLEALDEAEAEADTAAAVEVDFALPEDEYGEMMALKLKDPVKVEKLSYESENSLVQGSESVNEVKSELDSSCIEEENNKDTIKENRKETTKRGQKKKELTPVKDNTPFKKDSAKETPKKEASGKKEILKEARKGSVKEDDKKEGGKKSAQEIKKDIAKDDKKEQINKGTKRELPDKRTVEQTKKDVEVKKVDQKKAVDVQKTQRPEPVRPRAETPKQLRAEVPKRTDAKSQKSETPKPQRVEALKKESSAEKKKDATDKKLERKSPEKTPEAVRGAKLRTRERKDTDPESTTSTGTKRERSRDSTSKTTDMQSDETPVKKPRTPVPKGRSTRNSIEPPQKSTSPVTSPQKRRTRVF